ncbi:MAG TPA: RNA methyltransferase [Caulobacteraceae bacterium]|jgi:tRNA/rRNA methyltransferase|nr:RNA methyltransferase [Caulobacteraceae bacterium]
MSITPPCVILSEPQLAQNIGAVARVMANFGLADLRLVRPRDGWPQADAWPSASGAGAILDAARVFADVPAAIADLGLVLAATARPRETALPVMTPRDAAARLAGRPPTVAAGLLFGGERAGLPTEEVALAQGVVTIPVDAGFRSLNLAQAVAINAYEWRLTDAAGPAAPFHDGGASDLADGAALMGLYQHLEAELETAGFFHPADKKPSMIRNLRVALGKSGFTFQEVRTLRGVVTALSRGRGKVLAKLAAARTRAAAAPTPEPRPDPTDP